MVEVAWLSKRVDLVYVVAARLYVCLVELRQAEGRTLEALRQAAVREAVALAKEVEAAILAGEAEEVRLGGTDTDR